MTVIDHTVDRQAWPSFRVGTERDRGRPAHRDHRRGAAQRQPGRGLPRRRPVRRAQGAAAAAQGAVLPRPGHHPRRARRPGRAVRPAGGPPGRRQRPRPPRAWSASTRTSTARPSTTRTPSTATPPGARSRRWARCSAASRVPPVGGDTIWVNMAEAYRRLPEHVKAADRRPAGPAQHRGQLRRGHARASSGSPCTSGSPTPSTRSSAPTRRPARRSCSSTRSRRTSPTTTRRRTCASASTTRPGASELLNYLIRQAAVPEYQVRWRWTPNSFAIWDNRCTQHYAVQDYWPAVRKMERAGIVGDRPSDPLTPLTTDPTRRRTAMHFLDDSLFPENQEKLVITAAPYGPEWEPADFPEDIPLTMDAARPGRRWTAGRPAPRCCTSTCASSTARAPSGCRSSTSCSAGCVRPCRR